MRQNKYLRNRAWRSKHWHRIRNKSHPYETFCLYNGMRQDDGYWCKGVFYSYTAEAQIRRNFEWIDLQARYLESGTHKKMNASSWFRRQRNSDLRAEQRAALNKVRHGDYDAMFPPFKKDANWLYF